MLKDRNALVGCQFMLNNVRGFSHFYDRHYMGSSSVAIRQFVLFYSLYTVSAKRGEVSEVNEILF